MDWNAMAVVGTVARAHGIHGQVIVNPQTDFPAERFRLGADLFTVRGGKLETLRVTSARLQNGRPVIGVEGFTTMTEAEALAGCELRVPREWLTALDRGRFYHHDLVGCRVETADGENVGVVTEVDSSAGGSRLLVNGGNGEIQIPLVDEICTTVDVAAKRIVVNAPEGLLDLNR